MPNIDSKKKTDKAKSPGPGPTPLQPGVMMWDSGIMYFAEGFDNKTTQPVINTIIEKNVLIGEGVYFGDTIHATDNYNLPIIKQEYIFQGKVIIGEGSHLCRYSTISSECVVGKNVIICPNSFVVQKEIPSYSMAIGNPASLIEDYNKKNDKS